MAPSDACRSDMLAHLVLALGRHCCSPLVSCPLAGRSTRPAGHGQSAVQSLPNTQAVTERAAGAMPFQARRSVRFGLPATARQCLGMDREPVRALPGIHCRPVQRVLAAVVRHAQGAARWEFRVLTPAPAQYVAEFLHARSRRHLCRISHLRQRLTPPRRGQVSAWRAQRTGPGCALRQRACRISGSGRPVACRSARSSPRPTGGRRAVRTSRAR